MFNCLEYIELKLGKKNSETEKLSGKKLRISQTYMMPGEQKKI